jgi:hypothetical protein
MSDMSWDVPRLDLDAESYRFCTMGRSEAICPSAGTGQRCSVHPVMRRATQKKVRMKRDHSICTRELSKLNGCLVGVSRKKASSTVLISKGAAVAV